LTLHALASQIGYTLQHVSEVKLAKASASEAFVAACDRALDAGGRLLALYPAVRLEQVVERERRETSRRGAVGSCQEVDDVKRRAFIGLGLSVVLLGPEAAARASKDDWDRIAHAWSYEMVTAPDRQALLPGLAADLRRLAAAGGPQRAIAQLSSYVATIADPPTARRWWKRARAAADASGDSNLTAYIAGQHAVQGMYGMYTPAQVIELADEALAATAAPCAGRMHALGARARALAMLGRKAEARETLTALERSFERLPRDITREKLSVAGWPEERMHHVASFVGAFGGVGCGEAAGEEALRLYSAAAWGGPAQVKLHRATAEVDAGYAVATLSALSAAQRSDRFVRTMALAALSACERESVAGVAELREVLAA
jgi:hypothetical protein